MSKLKFKDDQGVWHNIATTDEAAPLPHNLVYTSEGEVTGDVSEEYILASEKGIASGVATLDSNAKVPKTQLPITDTIIYGETEPSEGMFWCDTSTPPAPTLYPIGGRVFYDDGANGATYTFYNSSENPIIYTDIASLASAVYYSIEGTPTKDRFYIYNNELSTNKTWQTENVLVNANNSSIGGGKLNSNIMKDRADKGTLWTYIDSLNTNETGGCDDWYVGNNAEQDKLKDSALVDWYTVTGQYIWSSLESDASNAYRFDKDYGPWDTRTKDGSRCVFGMRSF